MDKLLHLSFTAARMDYIAQVLAQRPYAEVAALMADIARQLAQQQGEPVADDQPGQDAGQALARLVPNKEPA